MAEENKRTYTPFKRLSEWDKKEIIIQCYKISKRNEEMTIQPSILKKYPLEVLTFSFLSTKKNGIFFVDEEKVVTTTKNMLDRYTNILGYSVS